MTASVTKHVAYSKPFTLADPNGAGGFLAYIQEHHNAPVSAVAEAEAARMKPFFEAMEIRLQEAARKEKNNPLFVASFIPVRSIATFFLARKTDAFKPETPYIPGSLKALFKEVADVSKNLGLSQISIIPESTLRDKNILNLIKEETLETSFSVTRNPFTTSSLGRDPTYSLGFVTVRSLDPNRFYDEYDQRVVERTTTCPILALDDGMLNAVKGHRPEKMLSALQAMTTMVSHDTLHHFTNATSGGNITNTENPHRDVLKRVFKEWTHQDTVHPLSYESSLLLSHAETWKHLHTTQTGAKLSEVVNEYFDELKRISKKIGNDKTVSPENHHAIMDYYLTAASFNLVRIFPLNDPAMTAAFKRMQEIDPDPPKTIDIAMSRPAPKKNSFLARTITNYKDAGEPLHNNDTPYISARRLQVAEMLSDIALTLSPAKPGSDEYLLHERIEGLNLQTFKALSPSSPIK